MSPVRDPIYIIRPRFASQQTLQVLPQAVVNALEKQGRLGQYAVVWKNGGPAMVGAEVNDLEIPSWLAEKNLLEGLLAATPESAPTNNLE